MGVLRSGCARQARANACSGARARGECDGIPRRVHGTGKCWRRHHLLQTDHAGGLARSDQFAGCFRGRAVSSTFIARDEETGTE